MYPQHEDLIKHLRLTCIRYLDERANSHDVAEACKMFLVEFLKETPPVEKEKPVQKLTRVK